jgi:flagellar biosynthesis regulator FlaF
LAEIWEILDPEGQEKSPLPRPEMPSFTEYHTGATRFSDLSSTERKDFLNAQHIYEAQLKEYTQQAQKLLDVRNKIQLSVSDAKKAQLPIEKTTKEWLRILTDGTKPTSAMAEGIRANLTKTLNIDIWLRDFCAAIRRIAESFATAYELRLSEGIQGLSFQAVGSAFRSWFYTRYPGSVAQTPTVRGSAFEARFAGEDVTPDEEEADTTNQGASSVGNGRKRQRANTSSATDRQKVKRARCKACDKPHDISRCWLAVEATRPPGWTPSRKAVDDFQKRLKKQTSLAELVEKARAEHEDQA